MKKKILIIGFGNMGLSHFGSFNKKNFEIDIVDKKNKIDVIKKNRIFNQNVKFLKKIPRCKNYLLTILATQSKERFNLIKKFYAYNNTKFLLLEKFCFLKLVDFIKFNKLFKKKSKTFINSWSYLLARKIKIKNKLNTFTLHCQIEDGSMLANITHIMHIFSFLNNNSDLQITHKTNFKVVKSSRRKNYDEIIGNIKIEDVNKNILTISTKKKMKYSMIFSIKQKFTKKIYKFKIKKNHLVSYQSPSKKKFEIQFPFSKITSGIFLKNCEKKNFKYMPSFDADYKLSTFFLKKFKVKIP